MTKEKKIVLMPHFELRFEIKLAKLPITLTLPVPSLLVPTPDTKGGGSAKHPAISKTLGSMNLKFCRVFNPILPGGGGKIHPLLFFLHHPKTAKAIKLKLSDFKDTSLRHLLQVKPVRYILSCCHGKKITKGTSKNLVLKKSEKSAIHKEIELKFGVETSFGPLS